VDQEKLTHNSEENLVIFGKLNTSVYTTLFYIDVKKGEKINERGKTSISVYYLNLSGLNDRTYSFFMFYSDFSS